MRYTNIEKHVDVFPISYLAKLITRSLVPHGYFESDGIDTTELWELPVIQQDKHIAPTTRDILEGLMGDVDSGRLEANSVGRDLITGEIIPDETYVSIGGAKAWLDERFGGGWFWEEEIQDAIDEFYGDLYSWLDSRSELLILVLNGEKGAVEAIHSDDPNDQARFLLQMELMQYRERYGDLVDREADSSEGAEKEPMKGRASQRHKERCRAVAALRWEENPDITIADMVVSDAITVHGCEESIYGNKTLRSWIKDLAPNRSPGRRKKG
jgi:hypothetical protein